VIKNLEQGITEYYLQCTNVARIWKRTTCSRICETVNSVKANPGKHRVTKYKCASRYIKKNLVLFSFGNPHVSPGFSNNIWKHNYPVLPLQIF